MGCLLQVEISPIWFVYFKGENNEAITFCTSVADAILNLNDVIKLTSFITLGN